MAEDVVCNLSRDLVALGSREAAFLGQVPADIGDDALTQLGGIDADIEELRAEIADDEQVDGVLQLRVRVDRADVSLVRAYPASGLKPLVEIHYAFRPNRRRRPRTL